MNRPYVEEVTIQVKINGKTVTAPTYAGESLLDFLRERARATEVKCGCAQGDCGTCTVIFAGTVVKSCLVLASQADGKEVVTIKGLAEDALTQKLQESFVNHGAVQCGFCTPGMIITARKLLEENPHPSREEIRWAISGNLCRCTGYQKIVDAVAYVAAELEEV